MESLVLHRLHNVLLGVKHPATSLGSLNLHMSFMQIKEKANYAPVPTRYNVLYPLKSILYNIVL